MNYVLNYLYHVNEVPIIYVGLYAINGLSYYICRHIYKKFQNDFPKYSFNIKISKGFYLLNSALCDQVFYGIPVYLMTDIQKSDQDHRIHI